jgi:hypothetical protein
MSDIESSLTCKQHTAKTNIKTSMLKTTKAGKLRRKNIPHHKKL